MVRCAPRPGSPRRTSGAAHRRAADRRVVVRVEAPTTSAAQWCLRRYVEELDRRFPTGFDPRRSISADARELTPPAGLLLLAWRGDEPVGCGALKLHGEEPAEVKRMWVALAARMSTPIAIPELMLHNGRGRAHPHCRSGVNAPQRQGESAPPTAGTTCLRDEE